MCGQGFTKNDFTLDEQTGARTCPAGHTVTPTTRQQLWRGRKIPVHQYRWPVDVCAVCPNKEHCLSPRKEQVVRQGHRDRSITEHPEEELLVHARAQQRTSEFRDTYRQRQRVEHKLARMMQLGARQARYFGRAKTELQWLIAATVANLTLASRRCPILSARRRE